MRVFVAEKPSVAKAIAESVGIISKDEGFYKCKDNTIVTYCFGHLLERAEPDYYLDDTVPVNPKTKKKYWRREDLPIIPDKFVKIVSSDKKKQVNIIKKLIKDAAEVVNAGDPDREGQLLVDEVLEYIGYKGKVTRYWQSAMDPVSVARALKNIVSNDKFYKWGVAAEGRGIADWLVGMNYSRQLTIKNKQLISVGRVQSPVLKLVVDRDLAIQNFKPHDFYNIEVDFLKNTSTQYKGKLEIPEDYLDPDGQLIDQNKANELKSILLEQNKKGIITSVKRQTKKSLPPLLFTLADLQVECSKMFNLSAKQTLDIAQELYEKYKLTTYPRSSCEYLPLAQKDDVAKILNFLQKGIPEWQQYISMAKEIDNNRVFNDKKVNEAAHTGIAPTPKAVQASEINALPDIVKKVYMLIVKRYISCFMPAYMYEEMTINTKVDAFTFKTILKAPLNLGFKSFLTENSNENNEFNSFPDVIENDSVSIKNVDLITGKTTPPKYFTEGSLIQAMCNISKYIEDVEEKKLLKETDGLGTEATRAEIIERLKKHEFIEMSKSGKTKGKIVSTSKGRNALKVIPKKLQSASLTARDEEKLREIQEGLLSLEEFINEKEKELKITMAEIDKDNTTVSANENFEKCPKCGSRLYRNESKNIKGLFYWRCSNKECGIFLDDLKGKPIEKKTCPKCGNGKLTRFESKYQKGVFTWCCNNQECKARFEDQKFTVGKEIMPKAPVDTSNYQTCPECKADHAVTMLKSKKNGKMFFKCIKCNSLFSDDNGKIGKCFNK